MPQVQKAANERQVTHHRQIERQLYKTLVGRMAGKQAQPIRQVFGRIGGIDHHHDQIAGIKNKTAVFAKEIYDQVVREHHQQQPHKKGIAYFALQ